jgi:hypothetical protein
MTNEEITAVLRANVAKTVKVIYRDGDTALALVQSVDDEGFVYDLAYLSGAERTTAFWTAFSEIADVQPVPPA